MHALARMLAERDFLVAFQNFPLERVQGTCFTPSLIGMLPAEMVFQ